jgi:hypothetical protein
MKAPLDDADLGNKRDDHDPIRIDRIVNRIGAKPWLSPVTS